MNINWVWRHSLEDDNEGKEREGGAVLSQPATREAQKAGRCILMTTQLNREWQVYSHGRFSLLGLFSVRLER